MFALGAVLAPAIVCSGAFAEDQPPPAPAAKPPASDELANAPVVQELVVTASTLNLIGVAETSSQGSVTKQEIALRPVFRVGQLLESIPGLVVTVHSGEGKANQYLLRGFNLDHGTDLATFIDGMPVNMRTHAHGQGYTDLNFFIPELAGGVDFTKGPYYANEGDFAAVGADHIRYVDTLANQVSVSAGTVGDDRLYAGGSRPLGPGRLVASGEVVHLNGPWTHGDNLHKYNAVLRYSQFSDADEFSVTGMLYRGLWHATTDQPTRAIDQGLIGRFGTLDPSDGGQSERYSLSTNYVHSWANWRLNANAYAIHYQLTLWNNFTHFLDDPINGDQHAQDDRRNMFGGAASLTNTAKLLGADTKTTIGLQTRYDDIDVDLAHTRQRVSLGLLRSDKVREFSIGAYAENTTYWQRWLRTIVGLREDYYHVADTDLVNPFLSGPEQKSLFQPKASLVIGPFAQTEFYASAGQGFHSNDGRTGVDENGAFVRPPLLVKAKSAEVGIRTTLIPHVQAAVTVFVIDFDSELTYNADAGQTEAGRPSHREGVEFTGQYRPLPWLEVSANLALSHSRYTDKDPVGDFIEDAPKFIASFGALVDNLGPWSAGVEFRDLGPHSLTNENAIRSAGYSEWNVNLGYKVTPALKVRLDVFNVLDSKDDAADYFYTSRLAGEPAAGVDDIHIHPLEPRSARLTMTRTF
jgi:hypothetical protein